MPMETGGDPSLSTNDNINTVLFLRVNLKFIVIIIIASIIYGTLE